MFSMKASLQTGSCQIIANVQEHIAPQQMFVCEYIQVYVFMLKINLHNVTQSGLDWSKPWLNASLCNMLQTVIPFIPYFVKPWAIMVENHWDSTNIS